MTPRKSMQSLSLALLATLTLGTGAASAAGSSCLPASPTPAQAQHQSLLPQDRAAPLAMSPEMMQHMARIEQALRNGEISAAQAGRLMRQQWELAQFQRGFLAGAPAMPDPAPRIVGPSREQLARACVLVDNVGASLAPLGGMAINGMQTGMQTATTVMRALMKEAEKLLREDLHPDKYAL